MASVVTATPPIHSPPKPISFNIRTVMPVFSEQHLFCYGTLCVPEIARVVLNGSLPTAQPAALAGYACYAIAGKDYPAILPAADNCALGLLYRRLTPADWACIDRYEGTEYKRIRVKVVIDDRRRISAWTYVLRRQYESRVSPRRWDLPSFIKTNLGRYLRTAQRV
jgi:gamma-glutamylcyclotransferase (GGCT)/AIG2-like uncharacterized protein YtfP